MKNILCIIWIVILGCQSERTSTLHGTVEVFDEGHAYLVHMFTRDTLARATIEARQFEMHLDPSTLESGITPGMILCVQNDRRQSIAGPVAIEHGDIHITLTQQGFPQYSGTPLQEKFSGFVAQVMKMDLEMQALTSKQTFDSLANVLGKKFDTFYIENRSSTLKQFASFIVVDQITKRSIDPKDLVQINAICADDSDLDSNDIRVCEAITAYYAQWEGTPVRMFEGQRRDNTTFRLEDVIGTKPVIIDFWASWCGPCIREIPMLKELYQTGNVDIIGVSIDDRPAAWLSGLDKLDMPWHNIRDEGLQIRKLYNVRSVPTKLVVDKEGIIAARNPEDLQAVLDSLAQD